MSYSGKSGEPTIGLGKIRLKIFHLCISFARYSQQVVEVSFDCITDDDGALLVPVLTHVDLMLKHISMPKTSSLASSLSLGPDAAVIFPSSSVLGCIDAPTPR